MYVNKTVKANKTAKAIKAAKAIKTVEANKTVKAAKAIKGQITIFMALIFMVIFTLFTMTVSLSMFIHDKINVQNATDLASYYVASKQAELLGAIAHNNYIIRQSYKLMVYRYRVYGNAARTDGALLHPGNRPDWQNFRNTDVYTPATLHNDFPPRVCIGSSHLLQEIDKDNQCKEINFNVQKILQVTSVVGSLISGINSGVAAINENIRANCEAVAYLNWYYANMLVGAHKYEQRDRRAIINALANNLARPIETGDGGMRDIEGGSVYDGARHTFVYNLTESNKQELKQTLVNTTNLTIENSMRRYLGRPEDWLVPIYINVSVPYSHFITENGCTETLTSHAANSNFVGSLTSPSVSRLKNTLDPTNNMNFFGGYSNTPPSDRKEILSIGVEKKPWVMVYNKIEARIFSRPLFLGSYIAPEGLEITALSHAKPFGGRIGPWYKTIWPQGSNESNSGDKTDELVPRRISVSQYGVGSIDASDPTLYPNYSRFPTDEHGLTTNEAMLHAGPTVGWKWRDVLSGFEPPTSIQDYFLSTHSYHPTDNYVYNDPLAQDFSKPEPQRWDSFNRRLEIAAIMPDAFDFTYYSISPNYYSYFISENGREKLPRWLQVDHSDVEIRGDLGAHPGQPHFSIIDQMFSYNSPSRDGTIPASGPNDAPFIHDDFSVERNRKFVPYFFTDEALALLTGWNKGFEPMSYNEPTDSSMNDYFATCLRPIDPSHAKPKIPSGCLKGGRFGYSVKLISGSYIIDDHPIGGDGAAGPIENPI